MSSNDTVPTIYTRRAVRKYKDKKVERRLINEIIEAGTMAPSAINMQPWNFHILSKKGDIEEFSTAIRKIAKKQVLKMGIKALVKSAISAIKMSHGVDFLKEKDPVFHGAPVVIFISADENNQWASLDVGMCAQNMMLAAHSMGLDTCPIGFATYVDQTEIYPKLRIPKSEKVLLAIIVGYGDESPAVHDRKRNNITYI